MHLYACVAYCCCNGRDFQNICYWHTNSAGMSATAKAITTPVACRIPPSIGMTNFSAPNTLQFRRRALQQAQLLIRVVCLRAVLNSDITLLRARMLRRGCRLALHQLMQHFVSLLCWCRVANLPKAPHPKPPNPPDHACMQICPLSASGAYGARTASPGALAACFQGLLKASS